MQAREGVIGMAGGHLQKTNPCSSGKLAAPLLPPASFRLLQGDTHRGSVPVNCTHHTNHPVKDQIFLLHRPPSAFYNCFMGTFKSQPTPCTPSTLKVGQMLMDQVGSLFLCCSYPRKVCHWKCCLVHGEIKSSMSKSKTDKKRLLNCYSVLALPARMELLRLAYHPFTQIIYRVAYKIQ